MELGGGKFLVLGYELDQLQQGATKQVRAFVIVESERHLIKIGRSVLPRDLVPRTDDAPITAYSLLLATDPISAIHWDDSNHLYALSSVSKKLYVFTVTPTLIAKVVGSPFAVPTGTPNALVVVPK